MLERERERESRVARENGGIIKSYRVLERRMVERERE